MSKAANTRRTSLKPSPQRIADLPPVCDRFGDLDELLLRLRSAVVPVTGVNFCKERIGARIYRLVCQHGSWALGWEHKCTFAIMAECDDAGRWVVGSKSNYKHTHGPHLRIIKDSSWTPAFARSAWYSEVKNRIKVSEGGVADFVAKREW